MLLNNLFIDNPINFEKRCKTRIIASCLLLVLEIGRASCRERV